MSTPADSATAAPLADNTLPTPAPTAFTPSSGAPASPATQAIRLAGIADYRRVPAFNVAENARILLRYEFIERRLLRVMAGWMPGTARWEAKIVLGRLIGEDAEHTQSLRSRILELRTSERILDRAPSPHLALVLDELVLADDWREFFTGVIALKTALLAAYRRHLTQTQPLVDQPTVRLLRLLIAEESEHIDLLAAELAADSTPNETERARLATWTQRIDQLLSAAAGVQGLDPVGYHVRSEELRCGTRTFHCDYDFALDARFTRRQVPRFLPGQEPSGGDTPAVYLGIALSRFAEMQAAQGVALSLYENDGQPWDYYYLTARHLWDETRHSAMGLAMLEDQGIDWTKIPLFVGNYHFYASLSPLDRLIRLGVIIELALMESGAKRREVELVRKHGLTLAETFQDYDWADEVNHVEYARRCLDLLMEGDTSTLEARIADINQRYADFRIPWEAQGGKF